MGCKTDLKPEEKQRRVVELLRQSKMTLDISKLIETITHSKDF